MPRQKRKGDGHKNIMIYGNGIISNVIPNILPETSAHKKNVKNVINRYFKGGIMKNIESIKRAARRNGKVSLADLDERDKITLLKWAGFPTNAGTIYIPGHDGRNHYLKYRRL
jgi:hypothetical protein